MRVFHYSPHKDLTVIDPKFMGTSSGKISPEYKQGINHLVPRSYLYTKDEPEHLVAQGRHKYETWLPKDFKLYDIGHDPEQIVSHVHQQSGMQGRGLADLVEHEIKNRGYHGYTNSKAGNMSHVIASFHPVEILKQQAHPHAYDWHDDGTEEPTQKSEYINAYKSEWKDKIPGGIADKKKPSDFDKDLLREGLKVEMEHTSDQKIALEIAMDHLSEDKNYYKKLKTIEKSEYISELKKDAKHPHLQAHGDLPKKPVNEQAGDVDMETFAPIMSKFGTVTPGKKTNLKFYQNLEHHHDNILGHVKEQGYQPYFAGGEFGKPDLANKNYNTKHLMIYNPKPESGGDFGDEKYTSAWRHAHELAHAQTYPMVNKLYGEGRRIGKLGQRTPAEAKRAIYWEHLAANKQRDIMDKLGYKMSDEDFNKEYNTVIGDATHRAIHGKFTEPSEMGFDPHSHKVDIKEALKMVDDHANKIGLEHDHDTMDQVKRRKTGT